MAKGEPNLMTIVPFSPPTMPVTAMMPSPTPFGDEKEEEYPIDDRILNSTAADLKSSPQAALPAPVTISDMMEERHPPETYMDTEEKATEEKATEEEMPSYIAPIPELELCAETPFQYSAKFNPKSSPITPPPQPQPPSPLSPPRERSPPPELGVEFSFQLSAIFNPLQPMDQYPPILPRLDVPPPSKHMISTEPSPPPPMAIFGLVADDHLLDIRNAAAEAADRPTSSLEIQVPPKPADHELLVPEFDDMSSLTPPANVLTPDSGSNKSGKRRVPPSPLRSPVAPPPRREEASPRLPPAKPPPRPARPPPKSKQEGSGDIASRDPNFVDEESTPSPIHVEPTLEAGGLGVGGDNWSDDGDESRLTSPYRSPKHPRSPQHSPTPPSSRDSFSPEAAPQSQYEIEIQPRPAPNRIQSIPKTSNDTEYQGEIPPLVPRDDIFHIPDNIPHQSQVDFLVSNNDPLSAAISPRFDPDTEYRVNTVNPLLDGDGTPANAADIDEKLDDIISGRIHSQNNTTDLHSSILHSLANPEPPNLQLLGGQSSDSHSDADDTHLIASPANAGFLTPFNVDDNPNEGFQLKITPADELDKPMDTLSLGFRLQRSGSLDGSDSQSESESFPPYDHSGGSPSLSESHTFGGSPGLRPFPSGYDVTQFVDRDNKMLSRPCTPTAPRTGGATFVPIFDLLAGLRAGEVEAHIANCTLDELYTLLPVACMCIALLPFGMSKIRQRLLDSLSMRCDQSALLNQGFLFFLNSFRDSYHIIRLFQDHPLMKDVVASERLQIVRERSNSPRERSASRGDAADAFSPPEDEPSGHKRQFSFPHARQRSLTVPAINSYGHVQDEDSYYDDANPIEFFRMPLQTNAVGAKVTARHPEHFTDPISGKAGVETLITRKIFQSNAAPLLVDSYLEGANDPTASWILKFGDDLRRDGAVLQMFRFMNELWLENGIKYCDKPVEALTYKCLPIGPDYGVIEFIPDCRSLKEVCDDQLAAKKARRRRSDLLTNGEPIQRLIATSAGSYMAAYLMGIRDRHYDNVLVSNDGTVFHIDFGYMLGEKVAGLDTSKFAITSDLHKLMGRRYGDFVEISTKAWFICRQNAEELLDYARVVFAFLYPPEIVEDFIKDMLLMHETQENALIKIKKKLYQAPKNFKTKMKNFVHSLATKKEHKKEKEAQPRSSGIRMFRKLTD